MWIVVIDLHFNLYLAVKRAAEQLMWSYEGRSW